MAVHEKHFMISLRPRCARTKRLALTLFLGLILLLACNLPTTTITLETRMPTASSPAPTITKPPQATQPSPPSATPTPAPTSTPTETPPPTATPLPPSIRFAVIGDYGQGTQPEQDVADLVKSWQVDFIITTGDNNYPSGAAATIDKHVGQYYHEFIYPYSGAYGAGADKPRFFPTLGNHDYDTNRAQAYLDYFTLPGNERYYDFTWGPAHFFALDSDSREPDGVGASTSQASWLQERLQAATEPWKIVYMHHPPYSSGTHGPVDWMRWPFGAWGATAVLSGHDHTYERLLVKDTPYFINGLGGGPIYAFLYEELGSQVRFNSDYGAMLVVADNQQITFQFITRRGTVIDTYQITK